MSWSTRCGLARFLALGRDARVVACVAVLAAAGTAQAGPDAATPDRLGTIVGKVVDGDGHPVAGCHVVALARNESPEAKTDIDGKFQLRVPLKELPGLGLIARHNGGTMQAMHAFRYEQTEPPEAVSLTLLPAREISVGVVDGLGHPVIDAWVAALSDYHEVAAQNTDGAGEAVLLAPADAPLQYVAAGKNGIGLDYFVYRGKDEPPSDPYKLPQDHREPLRMVLGGVRPVTVRVLDEREQPMAGIEVSAWYFEKPKKGGDLNTGLKQFRAQTNERGDAKFAIVPVDNNCKVTFWVRPAGYVVQERPVWDPQSGAREVVANVAPLVRISGTLLLPDGKPAAGIEVRASGKGHQFDGFNGSARTDERGGYELFVNPYHYYALVPTSREWSAPAQKFIVRDAELIGVDFALQPATRVHGRLTIGDDHVPLPRQYLVLSQTDKVENHSDYYELPEDERLPNPKHSNTAIIANVAFNTTTDDDGRFEMFVGPGRYYVYGPPNIENTKFEIADQHSLELNLHSAGADRGEIAGRVVRADDPEKGIPEARVTGIGQTPLRGLSAVTDGEGRFRTTRGLTETLVYAASEDRLLSGITKVSADAKTLEIRIAPSASAKARLVDSLSGEPLPGKWIEYGILIKYKDGTFNLNFGGHTTTGKDGEFTLEHLVPGWEYTIWLGSKFDSDGQPHSWKTVGTAAAERAGQVVGLGDMNLAPPDRQPTPAEMASEFFKKREHLRRDLDGAHSEAQREYLRVLVVVGDAQQEAAQKLVKLLRDDDAVRAALNDYEQIGVSVVDSGQRDELGNIFGLASTALGTPRFLVLDADGQVLATKLRLCSGANDAADARTVEEFLAENALERLDAEKLFADALARAKREDKRVFLQESATWCGPCRRLSRYLDEHSSVLDENYVRVKIDRRRFLHGQDVMNRVRAGKDGGIPWFVILDSDGKPLADSDATGGNVGFPTGHAEIDHFIGVLTTTAPRLSPEQIEKLRAALEK